MASGFPQLNIVLFNTGGEGSALARYGCMNEILDTVITENYPNLFILAQDDINGIKHRKLCEKLNQNPAETPHRVHAGVYPETNTHYDVEYLDEYEAEDALVPRLTACVLTTADIEMRKILLVSWHGPCTPLGPRGPPARQARFQRLVNFLDLLKNQKGCDMVIVGGDFNLPSGNARDLLGVVGGALLDNYTPTDDRPDGDPIDYVVYWPRDGFLEIEIAVLCPDLRGPENNRPFDHNILLYRSGGPFSDLVRQFASIAVYDDEEESDNAEDE